MNEFQSWTRARACDREHDKHAQQLHAHLVHICTRFAVFTEVIRCLNSSLLASSDTLCLSISNKNEFCNNNYPIHFHTSLDRMCEIFGWIWNSFSKLARRSTKNVKRNRKNNIWFGWKIHLNCIICITTNHLNWKLNKLFDTIFVRLFEICVKYAILECLEKRRNIKKPLSFFSFPRLSLKSTRCCHIMEWW